MAALKWVKENTENFGGDPNKITLLGESAGGSSVNFHIMSPLSKDLFHQAIAESGVDLCPWAIQPSSYGIRLAKELAQKLCAWVQPPLPLPAGKNKELRGGESCTLRLFP